MRTGRIVLAGLAVAGLFVALAGPAAWANPAPEPPPPTPRATPRATPPAASQAEPPPFSMPTPITFKRIQLDPLFRAEGVAVGDVNGDGKLDVMTGEVWYEAPGWKMHALAHPGVYNGAKGYSNCFANFTMSVRGDRFADSLVVGFPGGPCVWYENPRGKDGPWKKRVVNGGACNETPVFADLLGDGQPVLVFPSGGAINYYTPTSQPDKPWRVNPISGPKAPGSAQFAHGLGVGDVNGDGRNDALVIEGWWQAPEDRRKSPWEFHKAPFGPACANMLVYDVDGDGLNDVITSSAHGFGIWWFRQTKTEKGVEWKQQTIAAKLFSQSHAMILADINKDGVADVVVGKRRWAHGDHGDVEPNKPAVLYWIELVRPEKGKVEWRPHLIDAASGVGTQFQVIDLNGDGKLDVATSNKMGVHLFVQE